MGEELQENTGLNVQAILNERKFGPLQWGVFWMCFLAILVDGFDTASIGYIAPSLLGEWHMTRPDLGPVLSAALFGLSIGSFLAGPLADRFGRKTILIASLLAFGTICLASAWAGSLHQLVWFRFVGGMGLGAALPNAVTLVGEYCPEKRRSLLINAMFCGFPVGAALGGFVAAWIIPTFGWRAVLVTGGVLPLILVAVTSIYLPESIQFMVARGYPAERIGRVLRRITGQTLLPGSSFIVRDRPAGVATTSGIGLILSRRYALGSLMLWTAHFSGLLIFFALLNWMPVLFNGIGILPQHAALVTALFPLGGFGAIFSGWLMDRFDANVIIAAFFVATAAAIYAVGHAAGSLGGLMAAVFVAGLLMNTAQSSLAALAAAFYPTEGRATGVAWMLGVGRCGAIAGSFLVAWLTAEQLSFAGIFAVVAVPGLVAATALLIKRAVQPTRQTTVALGAE